MNIIVYCGANTGTDPIYTAGAKAVGAWIGDNGYSLIYGGGKAGLMGIVADAVLAHGGKVTGVIPAFLEDRELAHPALTELITVTTMDQRKQKMLDLGDVCLALPSGPGTLEEITEVISWSRIGKNDRPCICYDQAGYYRPLQALYDQMVEQGFLGQDDRNKLLFSDSLPEIESFIRDYSPPQARQYR